MWGDLATRRPVGPGPMVWKGSPVRVEGCTGLLSPFRSPFPRWSPSCRRWSGLNWSLRGRRRARYGRPSSLVGLNELVTWNGAEVRTALGPGTTIKIYAVPGARQARNLFFDEPTSNKRDWAAGHPRHAPLGKPPRLLSNRPLPACMRSGVFQEDCAEDRKAGYPTSKLGRSSQLFRPPEHEGRPPRTSKGLALPRGNKDTQKRRRTQGAKARGVNGRGPYFPGKIGAPSLRAPRPREASRDYKVPGGPGRPSGFSRAIGPPADPRRHQKNEEGRVASVVFPVPRSSCPEGPPPGSALRRFQGNGYRRVGAHGPRTGARKLMEFPDLTGFPKNSTRRSRRRKLIK